MHGRRHKDNGPALRKLNSKGEIFREEYFVDGEAVNRSFFIEEYLYLPF